jgi:hypothetical protein
MGPAPEELTQSVFRDARYCSSPKHTQQSSPSERSMGRSSTLGTLRIPARWPTCAVSDPKMEMVRSGGLTSLAMPLVATRPGAFLLLRKNDLEDSLAGTRTISDR